MRLSIKVNISGKPLLHGARVQCWRVERGVGVVLEYAEQGLNDLLGRKGVSILCML